jgi:hypothetical protein
MILLDQGEDGDDKKSESITDIDQFRVEEELARLVGDRETVEAENKQLKRVVSSLESQLVCISLAVGCDSSALTDHVGRSSNPHHGTTAPVVGW